MNVCYRYWLFVLLTIPCVSAAQRFSFTDKEKGLQIVYSRDGPRLDSIAAHLLANDIKLVTGRQPAVITHMADAKGNVIVIGNIASALVQQFTGKQSSLVRSLQGKWESFALKVIDQPTEDISKAFVIAGSDARGTAYGVFTLAEKIGVSPWYWWADVPVKKQKTFTIEQQEYISAAPAVQFRGIFINDEDWGLQPWAAKTFEPETGDIGPKTYARVFELLLRLKANLIWPAMHPSTKAFFHYPENKKVAEDYAIVIGTSHAEPMLRNNVDEWDEKTMGPFNYITNKEKVYNYWERRVKESTTIDALYTMGMRGVHDSGMEGVKSNKEAVPLLERIIKDQRGLLEKHLAKKADSIPQVFTAYKEVLDIYDNGLKLPDDITLVWPDDNYGYIHRLNNEKEAKRAGRSGVYYHASYWGRPHDYLWLSSLHPGLMAAEMTKAWQTGANRLWVINAGDIKPLEYNVQLFLDMAMDPERFAPSAAVKRHLGNWVSSQFGYEQAAAITNVLWQYYQLAFERRPEFMGWSRTEPTTETTHTEYNHFYFGDEAQQRINRYEALEGVVKSIRKKMQGDKADAFYQLVYYPVMGAAWMNKKFLYRDKAVFYAQQNRLSAHDYAARSKAAYDSIVNETDYYNSQMAGGKWKNMMSMRPRDLPVYKAPVIPEIAIDASGGWSIAPEGFVTKDSSLVDSAHAMALPAFDNLNQQRYFIDVFLSDKKPVAWKAVASEKCIRLSANNGTLEAAPGKNELRIWVDIAWNKTAENAFTGSIVFEGNGRQVEVKVQGQRLKEPGQLNDLTAIENNGFVSMHAKSAVTSTGRAGYGWTRHQEELGYTGQLLETEHAGMYSKPAFTHPDTIKMKAHYAAYDFYTFTTAAPKIIVHTLPTHPINNLYSLRYGVSIDDGPVTVVDLKTVGRSEEWKRNVLSNRAVREISFPLLQKGRHTLRIYAVDPAVLVDEIRIDLGGLKKAYSTLPETIPAGKKKK
ncbi:glycosyl hydrolase 115 family protein [Longitalea luteola]|uniref:glycosyl hydrolase 115 family protein n=1 Tax=Longitalea luteola TaxID=2812563 RepID=UPI001A96ABD3|nr:glycosyl hydrolase 115 family protein [Longitalea luteola]